MNRKPGIFALPFPIARALMKAEEGVVVELMTPNGGRRIEVVRIVYEEG